MPRYESLDVNFIYRYTDRHGNSREVPCSVEAWHFFDVAAGVDIEGISMEGTTGGAVFAAMERHNEFGESRIWPKEKHGGEGGILAQ